MRKEIVLPPHLYDRIKAGAGEHGGVGRDTFFAWDSGVPVCAHGLAWGTSGRMKEWIRINAPYAVGCGGFVEPELRKYLEWFDNDAALADAGIRSGQRISFEQWCELLNVKRGEETPRTVPAEKLEAVSV